jgi:hypothetical protein
LLPDKSVKVGDTWKASDAAVAELTDMEKVEKGELTCRTHIGGWKGRVLRTRSYRRQVLRHATAA